MDRVISTRERRYRRILGLGWFACLVLGPYLIFQFGNYHGRVDAYREEHAQKLYYLERAAEAAREAAQGEIYLRFIARGAEAITKLRGAIWRFDVCVGSRHLWLMARKAACAMVRHPLRTRCTMQLQW
jgi:hypothetical protein